MEQYVGLDVSLKETSLCVIDGGGRIVGEGKVATEVATIAAFLAAPAPDARRIGLETGPLTTWLWHGLRGLGLSVVCICARDAKPFLKRRINKTDRNDAVGIAELMRIGVFKEVHVKGLDAHGGRALLASRALLVKLRRDVENQARGLLKTFGLRVGQASGGAFEVRVRALTGERPGLMAVIGPLLAVRATLLRQIAQLDRRVVAAVREDAVCRRLTTADGVGPIVAMAYRCALEDAHRFRRSTSVGAYLGLTPRRFSSGEVDYSGRISKCGDRMVRSLLFEAAGVLLTRSSKWSALRNWGLRLAKRVGFKKAKVAVARKLAVILHRMWIDGATFRRAADAA
ncbi:MAG: IS110 family transposase [Candidatus Krumholzibacteriia bacterium]